MKDKNAPKPVFPADKMPSIRRLMMPQDTNALGSIFGGTILSEIDLAAAVVDGHRLLPRAPRAPDTT